MGRSQDVSIPPQQMANMRAVDEPLGFSCVDRSGNTMLKTNTFCEKMLHIRRRKLSLMELVKPEPASWPTVGLFTSLPLPVPFLSLLPTSWRE